MQEETILSAPAASEAEAMAEAVAELVVEHRAAANIASWLGIARTRSLAYSRSHYICSMHQS
jgi:hypothetical protein